MRRNLALSLGLAVATLILPQVAMAAPVSAVSEGLRTAAVSDGGMVQTVRDYRDYRGSRWGNRWRGDSWRWRRVSRCGIVRSNCASRFGWGSWRARQCTWRHGC